jgi:hypothetical protein
MIDFEMILILYFTTLAKSKCKLMLLHLLIWIFLLGQFPIRWKEHFFHQVSVSIQQMLSCWSTILREKSLEPHPNLK